MGEAALERYSRQVLVREIGAEGLAMLRKSRVAIIGCGATGSTASEMLARIGVGHLKIVDRDFVDYSNLPSAHLYVEKDAATGMPKAVAAAKRISEINSEAEVEPIVEDVGPEIIEGIIGDVDVVIDATDNMETRHLINEAAVKHGKPWVYMGVEQWRGMVMRIVPGVTACLRCLLPHYRTRESVCETRGVVSPAVTLTASLAVTQAVKEILGIVEDRGVLIMVDAFTPRLEAVKVDRRDDCPVCVGGRFELLRARSARVQRICGTRAVQVRPVARYDLNLREIRAGPGLIVESATDYAAKIRCGEYTIVLFRDGRAIVNGTEDADLAYELYEKIMKGLFERP